MRNSSLVKPPRADNLLGLKRAAEIAGSVGSVGERRLCGEAGPRGPVERRRARMQALVATGGGNPPSRMAEVSRARFVLPGSAGA